MKDQVANNLKRTLGRIFRSGSKTRDLDLYVFHLVLVFCQDDFCLRSWWIHQRTLLAVAFLSSIFRLEESLPMSTAGFKLEGHVHLWRLILDQLAPNKSEKPQIWEGKLIFPQDYGFWFHQIKLSGTEEMVEVPQILYLSPKKKLGVLFWGKVENWGLEALTQFPRSKLTIFFQQRHCFIISDEISTLICYLYPHVYIMCFFLWVLWEFSLHLQCSEIWVYCIFVAVFVFILLEFCWAYYIWKLMVPFSTNLRIFWPLFLQVSFFSYHSLSSL